MEKIKINEVVIVEGKYDKIRLSSLIDGYILQTDGFRIFADPDKQAMIRRLAESRGVLVLTDSDGAGLVIRNHLNGILPKECIRHAYIPDVFGKERRKARPSKEGKLGVEGMTTEILKEALRRAGVGSAAAEKKDPIVKMDLFEDGLTGGEGSAELRKRMLRMLQLPENLTTNAMLQAMNSFMTRAEYRAAVQQLKTAQEG
jgi:ribonuclease M5